MYAQLDHTDPVRNPLLDSASTRPSSLTAALRILLAACLLLFQTACASAGGGSSTNLPPLKTTAYQLGTGDEVKIAVYGFDPLSGTYVINDQGAISLPLAGSIALANKTVAEAEAAVAAVLVERQVAVNPSVSIQVIKYRPFYVLGEVQKPGSYSYQPGLSVLQAISVAGGYTFRADRKAYGISRTVDGRVVKSKVDEATLVQPGDTVIVYEAWF
jgi:protein involved in polysaccharide export with SLBB domain